MKSVFAASIVAVLMTTTASLADCSVIGVSVTCSGADTDGFSDTTDGLTLLVAPGATVSSSGDAIKLRNDATIENRGAIAGGDEAIVGRNALSIDNFGTITAADKGIDTEGYDFLNLFNAGSIIAEDKAVRAGPDDTDAGGLGLTLINTASGLIHSGDEGVETGHGAFINNAGSIIAFEDAIQLGEDGFVQNSGQIVSTGDDGDGIDIDSGFIVNGGLISSAAPTGAGIDVDAALADLTVLNNGTIVGNTGILVEDGTDGESAPNLRRQSIVNSGLLVGTGGTAFSLGAGDDLVTLIAGSTLVGAGLFGTGNDGVVFQDGYFAGRSGPVAGGLGLYGYTGFDRAGFGGLRFGDVAGFALTGDRLELQLATSAGTTTVILDSFEQLEFADARVAVTQGGLAPVPLPAGVVLLGAALAGLGLMRRRFG